MSDFTHLHLHTEYSMLDGTNKIKELAKVLKEQGVTSAAITDHGNMFGAIDFYKTMKSYGIKPLIGIEAYIHNMDDLGDKSTRNRFHLILLAKNEIGYKNLMYLSSMSFIEGFYYNPRINKKLLREHTEGIVCTGACLQGEVSWNLNINNERNVRNGAKGYEAAKAVAAEYKEIFGDDFYLEIMRHGISDQRDIDDQLLRIAKELDIKMVATNDVHYIYKDRSKSQEIYKYISGADMPNTIHEFYLKTPDDMKRLFLDMPEVIENTQEIVDKCNLEIKLGDATPPNFKFTIEYAAERGIALPEPSERYSFKNDAVFFEAECKKGLDERLKFISEEQHQIYKDRLQREIDIINKMNFPGYMMIVWDFINEAKKRGVPVGPGRGSAAGSLVAYALKITDLDPIPYSLLFERFLNPERVSMPDIDVDFCQDRRGEIIDYVIEKYGKFNVAGVITFGKLLAKGVIRDVARVCGMPYSEADAMAKLIPDELGITLEGAFNKEPEIKKLLDTDAKAAEVWKFALDLEGLNRNAGQHAAGVVISNDELWNKTPLFKQSNSEENHFVTQYSLKYLEDVDLIKFDFLGLKTLTVIDNAIKLIKQRYGKEIIWEQIDKNDAKVYEMLAGGHAIGIFQVESEGMRKLGASLRPDCFEDVIAMLALYRPGPMESGMLDDFVERKHGRAAITYAFDELEPILAPTYGVIVYQEQVMQIVQSIGGFSLGGADLVRRAMGKKIKEEMDKLKGEFVAGAVKNGLDGQKADDLFELIVKFAGYGFNKSHSAAYAYITFQTAYLKTYYPAEFMAALLTSEKNNVDKIVRYIDECKRLNIELLPPSINHSANEFSVTKKDGKDAIVFGFCAIKGVGETAIENIIGERNEGGEYKDMSDFVSRVDAFKVNKKVVESLIKSGSFDIFGHTRLMLMQNVEIIIEACKDAGKIRKEKAESLFGDDDSMGKVQVKMDEIKNEFDQKTKLKFEQESVGIYISGHPLDEFREDISRINYTLSSEFDELPENAEIMVVAKIEDVVTRITKSGKKIATLKLLDLHGNIEATVFERELKSVERLNDEQKDAPQAFRVEFERRDQFVNMRVREVLSLDDAANLNFKVKAQRSYKKDGYNKGSFENSASAQAQKIVITGVVELVLNLASLDKKKVAELYRRCIAEDREARTSATKRLVIKVQANDKMLAYNTDFIVRDEFINGAKELLVS
ncbi:DNA polymerase III subunit alpha [Campylobacter sp. 19-13652]|uniref:DNA polymerase III subunit alpha n=1 Tax=Campylobacter sp. 19-13652 TaxID=2840180 RepID=UPI001C78B657|nr:DNA polymerase III subunit alpha [Campylobacter sp. 19-13652]BCX79920.1 DNA polymerase III subunit alpha [Campylobacter sp. 19-13652]